ncbi:hypothetical protein, partial [Streptomyces hydrogenans]|uniref:hypothetical protein n=1 Tax=Streptomyces hydrogenans TaxID=1873719 RepID=UPI0035E09E15
AGDVRVEEREDPRIIEPTDAIVKLTATRAAGRGQVLPGAVPRRCYSAPVRYAETTTFAV